MKILDFLFSIGVNIFNDTRNNVVDALETKKELDYENQFKTDKELMQDFKNEYQNRNGVEARVHADELVKRGILTKDENGKYVKKK